MVGNIQARPAGIAGVKSKPPVRPEASFEPASASARRDSDQVCRSAEACEKVEGHSGIEALMANFRCGELKPTEKVEEVKSLTTSTATPRGSAQDSSRKAQQQRKLDGTGGSLKASKVKVNRPTPEQLPPLSSRGAPKLEVPRPVGQAEASARSKNPTLVRQRSTLQIATRDRTPFSPEVSDDV